MPPDRLAPPDILCRAVAKTFGDGHGAVKAVAPTDLALSPGTTTALVGPSGCGKSTLLRMIAGLETATEGSVRIGGEHPDTVRRSGTLAVAFQDPSLLPWRTVASNIELARHLARLPRDPDMVADLIRMIGLAGFEDRRPAELSGGMRQRAAIARCLVTAPRLLLLDEPFGAVDELTRRRLNVELPPVWERQGATTLLVTHSVSEAVLLSDRVVVLSDRPARVIGDIVVTLARPRCGDMVDTDPFREIAAQVTGALFGTDAAGPKIAAAAE